MMKLVNNESGSAEPDSATNQTERIVSKNGKESRACSVCKKSGHNSRSCPIRKAAAIASGATPVAVTRAPRNAVAENLNAASASLVEFEESTKQVVVNGTAIRLITRESSDGDASLSLRLQSDASGVKDFTLSDLEVASALSQMLSTVLQRLAGKGRTAVVKPATTPANGMKVENASL